MTKQCGYVGLIGRPNVGKSTLLNRILGEKVSITSSKPQTTRQRVLGIKTIADVQTVYVDTPGLHRDGKRAMNRTMNKAASDALNDVDVIVFIVEGLRWNEEDEWILSRLQTVQKPILLVINKIDNIPERTELLPHIQMLNEKLNFAAVVPLSAHKGENIAALEKTITELLPEQEHFFEADQLTDRNDRFMAAELIREKLIRNTGEELPYATTVEIEQFKEDGAMLRISAVIWVERAGQKAIIIGKKGDRLKTVGTAARIDMEKAFGRKVFLQLWVKVRKGWSDDERALQSLGISE